MSFSPFLNANHGHPNFAPVKVGKNVTLNNNVEAAKNSKQPKPPDKPLMPYMRYSKKVWDEVRARYPEMKIWEISKIVGQMWRDLPEEEKQDYIDAFEAEKVEYNELLKIYHNSPAYQTWISSLKSKANKEHEERDNHKQQKNKKSGSHGMNSPQKLDGRISLQTMDNDLEDEDDYFSIKHLAAARFYRNHKLVSELFSDAQVPDTHTNSSNRYVLLRRQAESLASHHQTLNQELQQIEEKFQERKRALLDSSEKFITELNKRFAAKPVDEAAYQRMVDKALEQIQRENGIIRPAGEPVAPAPAAAAERPPPPAAEQSDSNDSGVEELHDLKEEPEA